MAIPGVNGLRLKRLLFISVFRGLLFYSYSTTSSAAEAIAQCAGQTHFMVDYLINSLGFSRQQAISASSKLTHMKSTRNPDLVIHFFKQNGLDEAYIRRIVSSVPRLLLCNVEKTIEPKFKFLKGLGLSGSDLTKLISGNGVFFRRSLDTFIIPRINYLKELLNSEENVVKVIRRSNWLLSSGTVDRMRLNVVFLKECNFSNDFIKKFFLLQPRNLIQKLGWLEVVVRRTRVELGIGRESPMFFRGMLVVASNNQSTLERKFGVFRSFGWTDSDISTLSMKFPSYLSSSETKIRDRLKFFTQVLGLSAEYLVHHPVFFGYSLEKRILPRYEVLKILKEKKLLRSEASFYYFTMLSEAKFVQSCLLPYKDELPDVYQDYMKRMY